MGQGWPKATPVPHFHPVAGAERRKTVLSSVDYKEGCLVNIADNLQHLETHYINIWIKKWEQQLAETDSELLRKQLQENIDKAKREIKKREEGGE